MMNCNHSPYNKPLSVTELLTLKYTGQKVTSQNKTVISI